MPQIRYIAPEGRPEARTKYVRARVNKDEREHFEALAAEVGLNMSDYIRALVGLPALHPGAPPGNANHKGKRGGNQHSKRK